MGTKSDPTYLRKANKFVLNSDIVIDIIGFIRLYRIMLSFMAWILAYLVKESVKCISKFFNDSIKPVESTRFNQALDFFSSVNITEQS